MSETETNKVQVLQHIDGQLKPDLQPIVIEYKKRKKKRQDGESEGKSKEKYSAGLEDIQRLEGDVMHVAQKATKALSKGIDTYELERQKSAKEKTDGAVEDYFYNSAKAVSVYLKEASDIPVDLAESLNRTSLRKRLRKSLRRASKTINMFRL